MEQKVKPKRVLVVEDNETDLLIIQEAFDDTQWKPTVVTARNGEDAMKRLRRGAGFENEPLPDLILLDINMPRKNGHDVLAEIKQDRTLLQIPVIILTTSTADSDVAQAYANHANSYIRKPVDFEEFEDVIAAIEKFWADTAVPAPVRTAKFI